MMMGALELCIVAAFFLSVPAAVVMVLGGLKMKRLESHGLALTAAIVAMLPLTPAWPISLPFGLWALIVLTRPEVKAAFDQLHPRPAGPQASMQSESRFVPPQPPTARRRSFARYVLLPVFGLFAVAAAVLAAVLSVVPFRVEDDGVKLLVGLVPAVVLVLFLIFLVLLIVWATATADEPEPALSTEPDPDETPTPGQSAPGSATTFISRFWNRWR